MHPLAANFLEQNCQNIPVSSIPLIQCHCLSFAQAVSSLAGRERYDWCIVSNLLYETGEPKRLLSQIKPSAEEQTQVMIIDHGREQLLQFEPAVSHHGFSDETGNNDQIRWRRFSR